MSHYLLLKKLSVRHANALSGQYLHGFPGMTAFMGFMWALERKWNSHHSNQPYLRFTRIGVIAHDYREHAVRSDNGLHFSWKKAPVEVSDKKNGLTKNASFNMSGYIDMTVSLVIEVERSDASLPDSSVFSDDDLRVLAMIVKRLRIAGGRIDTISEAMKPAYCVASDDDSSDLNREIASLGYGNAIVSRDDVLEERRRQLVDAWKIIDAENDGMEVSSRLTDRSDLLPRELGSEAPVRRGLPADSMFSASPSDLDVMLSMFFFLSDPASARISNEAFKQEFEDTPVPEDASHLGKRAQETARKNETYRAILEKVPYLPDAARKILTTRPKGWIVPLVVGYVWISDELPPGTPGARDDLTSVVPSETVTSFGEWISIRRVMTQPISSVLWSASTVHNDDGEKIAFVCKNT